MNETDAGRGGVDLPPELANLAGERFLALPAEDWAVACDELVALHPDHAASLRRLCADLAKTELLLARTPDCALPEESVPEFTQLHGYPVLRRLGEGAFGIVYLCQQTHPVQRLVAVKVLRPGSGDRGTLRRFNTERQLLAQLAHPAITQVFDAGVLPDGRPFFVMECVAGKNLRDYCAGQNLSTAALLHLFLEVCRGVAHAHHRGIVHRDLKPANVLVVDTEQGPRAKVIDFGIAKALSPDLGGDERTGTGRVIGTPGYMSPEQAAGHGADVDGRADVFSLGVMLYELLTGEMPWPRSTTTDSDPVRPSARVATTTRKTAGPGTGAKPRLAAELRGDLDWILLKAIARGREERYATATDLIDDIERHLRGAPVAAGPPTLVYRLRKLARRHRAGLAWACAFLVLLAVGITVAQHFRAEASTSEQARLLSVANAVASLRARALSPQFATASDQIVRQLLHDALQLHEKELGVQPVRMDLRDQRLQILGDIANLCFMLGDYRGATAIATQALAEADALLLIDGGDGVRQKRANAARELARCHYMLGEMAAARKFGEAAVMDFELLCEHGAKANAKRLAKALVETGSARAGCGDLDGQLAAQQRALEVLGHFADEAPEDAEAQRDLVRFHCGLSTIQTKLKDVEAAEAALQQAQQLVDSLPLVTDEERALVDMRWARCYGDSARPELAIRHARLAMERTEQLLQLHPERAQQRSNLVQLRATLFGLHHERGEHAAATAQAEALMAMADGPSGAPSEIGIKLIAIARNCAGVFATASLALAERCLVNAGQRLRGVAAAEAARIESEMVLGTVLDDLGRPWPASRWLELARSAAEAKRTSYEAFATLHASCARLREGDVDAARRELASARSLDGKGLGFALLRQALAIELAGGDAEAIATAVEQLLAGSPADSAKLQAARGLWAAHSLVAAANPMAAAGYRSRADALAEGLVATSGNDAARALLRAQAGLLLAELRADDPQRAAELLRAHLPTLDRLRDSVPATWWQEPEWQRGHRRSIGAAVSDGRFDTALNEIEALVPRLRDPEGLIALCTCCGSCVQADRSAAAAKVRERAVAIARTTLRRALDCGLRASKDAQAIADLQVLLHDADFSQLVASIPD